MDRSMYYYESVKDDTPVEEKLRWYASKMPTRGFPEYCKRIRQEGITWNHKRIYRVYTKLGMNRRKRSKRRIPNPERQALLQPTAANITWSMDFMHDSLENGRKFRTLNIIDDYNRQALAIEIKYSFTSEDVVNAIEQLIDWKGKPQEIRTDNGTEFMANCFQDYCKQSGINHIRIQKGKPNQNAYIERFNRTFREDVLDAHIFTVITQAKELTLNWMEDYNLSHPHSSLGNMSPLQFLKRKTIKNPKLAL